MLLSFVSNTTHKKKLRTRIKMKTKKEKREKQEKKKRMHPPRYLKSVTSGVSRGGHVACSQTTGQGGVLGMRDMLGGRAGQRGGSLGPIRFRDGRQDSARLDLHHGIAPALGLEKVLEDGEPRQAVLRPFLLSFRAGRGRLALGRLVFFVQRLFSFYFGGFFRKSDPLLRKVIRLAKEPLLAVVGTGGEGAGLAGLRLLAPRPPFHHLLLPVLAALLLPQVVSGRGGLGRRAGRVEDVGGGGRGIGARGGRSGRGWTRRGRGRKLLVLLRPSHHPAGIPQPNTGDGRAMQTNLHLRQPS